MRLSFIKCAFVLLGTCCFIICNILYGMRNKLIPNSKQTEGGSIKREDQARSAQQEDTIEAPCSLRKAVRNDPLFNKNFSFSVPVLQWTGSFSKHSWEKLKNDRPPYGWKGLPIDVVNSTLSLLKSSRLFDRGLPDRCVRCAVVGNGGILRGSKQGKNIDSHDFVFRVNGAVIRGFEEDVGTKVSFYGFTANTMTHALRWYKKDGFTKVPQGPDIKYIFIPSDLRDYVMAEAALQGQTVPSGRDMGDKLSEYFSNNTSDSFKFLHPEFISYVTKSFLNSRRLTAGTKRMREVYMPSTGALMLLTALHTCDQVSAYGFITRNYAAFSDHYYDSKYKPLLFYINHDMLMECQLWEALHLQNIMKLYQRSNG